MRRIWISMLMFLLAFSSGFGQERAGDVRIGKYKDLTDLVLKNKGKVILVDFWFTT